MWQEKSADDLGSVLSLLQDEWRDLENGLIEFVGDRYLSADKKRTLAAAALNAELDATRALIRGNRLAQRGVGTSVLRPGAVFVYPFTGDLQLLKKLLLVFEDVRLIVPFLRVDDVHPDL